jgi:hypothetical protein
MSLTNSSLKRQETLENLLAECDRELDDIVQYTVVEDFKLRSQEIESIKKLREKIKNTLKG